MSCFLPFILLWIQVTADFLELDIHESEYLCASQLTLPVSVTKTCD